MNPNPVKSRFYCTLAELAEGVVKVTQNVLEHILLLEFRQLSTTNKPSVSLMRSGCAIRAGTTESYSMTRLVSCY